MIKLKYPVSTQNLNKLNDEEKIVYSGKIILVHPESAEKILNYYKLEGAYLYNFIRDIIIFGSINKVTGEIYDISFMHDFSYSKLFLNSGILTFIFPEDYLEKAYFIKRINRPLFVYQKKSIRTSNIKPILHDDIENGGTYECWLDAITLKIYAKGDNNSKF
jgi:hypothetical protein